MHGGKFYLTKISDGTRVVRYLEDTSPSKLSAMISEVATTLSTTVADISYRGIHRSTQDGGSYNYFSKLNHNSSSLQEALN